jgi:TonB family protein
VFKRLLCLLLVSSVAVAKDDVKTLRPERAGSGTPRVCGIVAANPKGAMSGTTVIAYTVGIDGKVGDARVTQSSGKPNLDLAATACAGTWRFKPATRSGKPVAFPDTLKISWAESNVALVPDTMAPADVITVTSKPPPPLSSSAAGQPLSIGRPHECSGYYPPAAVVTHSEGSVVLAFTVATDGSTKDVKIRTSSGSADLDAASLACVAQWRYRPATRDGVPVEMPWQAKVVWAIPADGASSVDTVPGRTGYTVPPTDPGAPHDCSPYYPAGANGASGDVELSFLIDARGALWDFKVARSSGDVELDRAAATCASFWKFKPALNGTTPVGLTWHVTVHMARKG